MFWLNLTRGRTICLWFFCCCNAFELLHLPPGSFFMCSFDINPNSILSNLHSAIVLFWHNKNQNKKTIISNSVDNHFIWNLCVFDDNLCAVSEGANNIRLNWHVDTKFPCLFYTFCLGVVHVLPIREHLQFQTTWKLKTSFTKLMLQQNALIIRVGGFSFIADCADWIACFHRYSNAFFYMNW